MTYHFEGDRFSRPDLYKATHEGDQMANANYFAIQSKDHPELLWSNADGWTDGEDFDLFTITETETLSLPIGGQWVRFANIIRNH